MESIPSQNAKSRLDALHEERHDLLEHMQDLLDEAAAHAAAHPTPMDQWMDARRRLNAEAARLGIVNEQIARLELGRGSRALPTRTQSQQVER